MSELREAADQAELLPRLKAASRTDYLHALLLPEPVRTTALVLRAYHHEVLSIVRNANEPALAAIRLQWWADGVRGERAAELRSHPIGQCLAVFADERPHAREALASKAETHADNPGEDQFNTKHDLEKYAGATRSVLLQLIAAEGGEASNWTEACGHAGVTELVSDHLNRSMATAQGRLVPNPTGLPDDATDAERIEALALFGLRHGEAALRSMPKNASRALLARSAVDMMICEQAAGRPEQAAREGIGLNPLRLQWAMWRF